MACSHDTHPMRQMSHVLNARSVGATCRHWQPHKVPQGSILGANALNAASIWHIRTQETQNWPRMMRGQFLVAVPCGVYRKNLLNATSI